MRVVADWKEGFQPAPAVIMLEGPRSQEHLDNHLDWLDSQGL